MAEISYQKIFNVIKPSLPNPWDSIVIYAGFSQNVCDIKYLVWKGNLFTECYDLNIDGNILLRILFEVQNEIVKVRNSLDDSDRWNSVKITITSQGTFESEFGYSDEKH